MIKGFNMEYFLENNFESKIIYRGEEYYYQNMVKSVIWNRDSLEVQIVGTDIYLVTINIKRGKIDRFSCSCPYEYHCKHEVAAIIYLYENLHEINQSNETENKRLKDLEQKIKNLSLEELQKIILEFMRKNEKFRNYLLKKYKIGVKNE